MLSCFSCVTGTKSLARGCGTGRHVGVAYSTAAQALQDGYSYPLQHFHVQRGNWLRIDHGVYRFREFADLPAEEHDHLVRWTLWSGGRAVVSHASALGVHDLGIANPAEIHLTVPPGFRKRDPAVVLYRGRLQPDEVEEHEGFQVTTPVRAIVESAADGTDHEGIDSAVAVLLDRGAAYDNASSQGRPVRGRQGGVDGRTRASRGAHVNRYATSVDLRRALESRLRQEADESGIDYSRGLHRKDRPDRRPAVRLW